MELRRRFYLANIYLIAKNETDRGQVSPTSHLIKAHPAPNLHARSIFIYLSPPNILRPVLSYRTVWNRLRKCSKLLAHDMHGVKKWINRYSTFYSSSNHQNQTKNNTPHSRLRKAHRNPLFMVAIMDASAPRQDLQTGWTDDTQRYDTIFEWMNQSINSARHWNRIVPAVLDCRCAAKSSKFYHVRYLGTPRSGYFDFHFDHAIAFLLHFICRLCCICLHLDPYSTMVIALLSPTVVFVVESKPYLVNLCLARWHILDYPRLWSARVWDLVKVQ